MKTKSPRSRKLYKAMLMVIIAGCFAAAGSVVVVSVRPAIGAWGADYLRGVIGPQATAQLEMTMFQIQDDIQKIKFALGLATPAAPWQTASAAPAATAIPTSHPPAQTATPATPASKGAAAAAGLAAEQRKVDPPPTRTPTPTVWQPAPLAPMGTLQGEGVWTPYVQDANGHTLIYRTFLEPDPNRPFALVAVVAIDLRQTRLHFVLGYQEPYSPDGPKRSGAMPAADKAPGVLLAMFNGGFKAANGQYGAMADGVTALPPINGLGTLAIYKDGSVRLGVWGQDIQPGPNLVAWRQNGPLIVQNGKIDPKIYDNNPWEWGYTVKEVSPTWRSAMGISADGQTLYYFAGPSLSMQALAKAIADSGAYNAMQLDINNYWVLFVGVHTDGQKLVLDPLFKQMNDNADRYLYPYSRDYFYVTVK
jgi:hypothetical protein